jgi:hypothetical protein
MMPFCIQEGIKLSVVRRKGAGSEIWSVKIGGSFGGTVVSSGG